MKDEFNYKNMEKELLHAVWEEETIRGIQGDSLLYQQAVSNQKGMSKIKEYDNYNQEYEQEYEQTDGPPPKQPAKLVAALLASTAAFAGLAFFLHNFSTEYVYETKEAEYQNCLVSMTKKEYPKALASVESLLESESDNLAYLALKNTICEQSGDHKGQKSTLKKIIRLDADNFQAYEKLLALYLEEENQNGIEKLAADAPTSAIASMLSEYLVDAPYLVLTPGVYDAGQTLSITSERGNDIYYTLDGSSPEENGIRYASPVSLEQGYIYSVRAVCKNERGAYGDEAVGDYQIGINAVNYVAETGNADGMESTAPGTPEIYPQSGTYTSQQQITIDVPIGYQAYYSWSLGTALTPQNGTLYTGGITMPEGNSVLSVILTDANGNSSEVKQASYTYQAS
ncbi:MAG: chitobiase/beta-hexosaminidase C-terminal domain-containing protein [Eubacterium sp.]|nr:chitobiase/beta-hexosaminidase C-terminal domain-containing protein [Eubacterium sp.]